MPVMTQRGSFGSLILRMRDDAPRVKVKYFLFHINHIQFIDKTYSRKNNQKIPEDEHV